MPHSGLRNLVPRTSATRPRSMVFCPRPCRIRSVSFLRRHRRLIRLRRAGWPDNRSVVAALPTFQRGSKGNGADERLMAYGPSHWITNPSSSLVSRLATKTRYGSTTTDMAVTPSGRSVFRRRGPHPRPNLLDSYAHKPGLGRSAVRQRINAGE